MGGQLIMLDHAPITWRTSKLKSACLSTMESKFVSMTNAVKELIWFDRIMDECISKGLIKGPKLVSELFVDNMATIDFVKSPIENHRTKHIDVKLFFIKDLFYKDAFIIKYITSKENLSEILTKPLAKVDLERFIHQLMLRY